MTFGSRELIVTRIGVGLTECQAAAAGTFRIRPVGSMQVLAHPPWFWRAFVFLGSVAVISCGGSTDEQAPVASVSVTPASLDVAVGRAAQLTATPRDAAGNPLPTRPVSWASSDADVAEVDATGMIGGVAEGPATITATSEGQSGSASVTVTAAGAAFPNEPTGAIPLVRWAPDFSGTVPADFPGGTCPNGACETDAQPWSAVCWAIYPACKPRSDWGTTVIDPTAPVNPTKVGRMEINPTNTTPPYGSSVEKWISLKQFIPPGTGYQFYNSYWFKLSANFRVLEDVNEFKHITLWPSGPGGWVISQRNSPNSGFDAQGQRSLPPYRMHFYFADGTNSWNVSGNTEIYGDTWYHIEYLLNFTTHRAQLWINGVLELDGIANVWPDNRFGEYSWVWTYGGGRSTIVLDRSMYMYVDDFYASYVLR